MGYSASEDITQIISSLSHELRTPLTILSSNLQLLKQNNLNLEEEVKRETFQLCDEALISVTKFLNGIHFLNAANKKEIKKSVKIIRDIDELVQKILNDKTKSFCQSKRVFVDTNGLKHTICTDELLLSEIIANLLDNAYKFSSKDVFLRIKSEKDIIIIEIEDQGVGIPNDQISLIFNPFYRCDNVKMINGTGLGLSIVQQATECLNGEIKINSTLSKGTNVEIKIPSDEC